MKTHKKERGTGIETQEPGIRIRNKITKANQKSGTIFRNDKLESGTDIETTNEINQELESGPENRNQKQTLRRYIMFRSIYLMILS